MKKYKGFTLTEVLLAVVIVGIIAALVLPTLITHYQDKGFSQKYTRETQTIKNTIDGLATTENKGSFFETMMYVDAEPQSYADSSEKFLKKYMRVSKLCGDNNGDCFAKTYYEYKGGDKIVYKPDYKGSCAILKNGSSICIVPQIVNSGVSGIIDINGPKGPNVLGKDLDIFGFDYKTRTELSKATGKTNDTQFLVEIKDACEGKTCDCGDLPPCDPCEGKTCDCGDLPPCTPPDPCVLDPKGVDCCKTIDPENFRYLQNKYCCEFVEIKKSVPYCSYIKVDLDCTFVEMKDFGVYDYMNWTYRCTLKRYWTDDHFYMRIWGPDMRNYYGRVYSKNQEDWLNIQTRWSERNDYMPTLDWSLVNEKSHKSLPKRPVQYDPKTNSFHYEYEGPNF